MEKTIHHFEMEKNSKDELTIPLRMNQQHKFEEHNIESCREDQKEVLAYILQYIKRWEELDKTPESIESFVPLRMTLCGVAGSGKSTLINALVTAIQKITEKLTVCKCVVLQDPLLSMLVVKHATSYSTSKDDFTILIYQHKP